MRILFDNGTPRQLRRRLFSHEVKETLIFHTLTFHCGAPVNSLCFETQHS